MERAILVLLLLSFATTPSLAAGEKPARITVSAPDRAYFQSLLSAGIDLPEPPEGEAWWLLPVEVMGPPEPFVPIPCQVGREGSTKRLYWIEPPIRKGGRRTYELVHTARVATPGGVVTPPPPITVEPGAGKIDIAIGGKPFTTYNTAADLPKPYFYPVLGPTGANMVRNYPMKVIEGENHDHRHHRGIWFTFGEVFTEHQARPIDFWAEGGGKGRIVLRELEAIEQGPVFGRIQSRDDWLAPDGTKVLEDERDIRIWSCRQGHVMDIAVTIRATEGPIRFGGTKEGMFGIRVASTMRVRGGKGRILNARGDRDRDAWGKQAEWCDYAGPVGGLGVGFAILEHPDSAFYPTYWHVRDYGLFAANPFGLRYFVKGYQGENGRALAKGGSWTFRYRVLLHGGSLTLQRGRALHDQYAHPPRVEVKRPRAEGR